MARDKSKKRMSVLAEDLGINDMDVTVSFEETRERIVQDVERITETGGNAAERLQGTPLGVPDVLGRMRAKKTPWTLGEIVKLREDIGDEYRAVQRQIPKGVQGAETRARALPSMRESIDDFIEKTAEAPIRAQELAENYRTYIDTYFREHVDVFERALTRDILRRDGKGFYRTEPEVVAGHFFEIEDRGGVTHARELKRMVGSDPKAMRAYEAIVLDSLYNATVREGLIDSKAFANWQKRYGKVVAEFPEIAKKVSKIQKANVALLTREAELAGRAAAIDASA